jgi:hypothetical protein
VVAIGRAAANYLDEQTTRDKAHPTHFGRFLRGLMSPMRTESAINEDLTIDATAVATSNVSDFARLAGASADPRLTHLRNV